MNKKCYIVGLPGSGKTTFLAALWSIITMTNDRALELKKCTNQEYMNGISEKWLSCNQMEHTSIETVRETSVEISETENGTEFTLVLPDRDGEYFKYEKRQDTIEADFHAELKESDIILFFINPAIIRKELAYGEVTSKYTDDKVIPEAEDSLMSEAITLREEDNIPDRNRWEENTLGDVAEHAELLNSMLHSGKKPLEIRIIVSAWDVFYDGSGKVKPGDIIKDRMKLFWQMVETHKEDIHVVYWGLSAQGGDWNDEEERKVIAEKNAEDRIIVVDQSGRDVGDMTRILL